MYVCLSLMINSYPFTHSQLTNAHHRHTNSYFHAVSESVTSCVLDGPCKKPPLNISIVQFIGICNFDALIADF